MPIGKIPVQNQGFTYIGLLMLITIAGIGMAGVGVVWHQDMQREREKELLFIGDEYRKAIGRYYQNAPAINPSQENQSTIKQFPIKLDDLVTDNRFLTIKHHLRKLYLDPISNSNDWGLVMQQGKIIGVYSNSKQKPIKKFGFAPQYENFAEAESYSDWKFIYSAEAFIYTDGNL